MFGFTTRLGLVTTSLSVSQRAQPNCRLRGVPSRYDCSDNSPLLYAPDAERLPAEEPQQRAASLKINLAPASWDPGATSPQPARPRRVDGSNSCSTGLAHATTFTMLRLVSRV